MGKINIHNNKIPKEDSLCICVSVILIDSVFRTGKNCYCQMFSEQCKYVVTEKRMTEYITDDIEFLLMILIKKILIKNILMKKILMKKIKYRMCLVFIFLISQMIHP